MRRPVSMIPSKTPHRNSVPGKGLFLLFFFISFHFLNCGTDKTKADPVNAQADSVVFIRIAVTGDIMCHSPQVSSARTSKGGYDFNPVFRYINKYLQDADFAFGNFETVTAGSSSGYSGYPFFNSPDELVTALKNSGFYLLTTANNHALDQGEKGVRRTIDVLNQHGIHYNGTFTSERDRDSIRVIDIKGIKVAFLAYSYGTNGLPVPKGKKYLINLIDTIQIRQDIERARQSTDIVLVHYHFGEEYKRYPSKYQQDVVNKTIRYGADIIIGGHPHVLQPSSLFKTNKAALDTGYVIYSMGNFLSNQRKRFTDAGVVVFLNLQRNYTRNTIKLASVDYVPTWVYRGYNGNKREYIILPADSYNDSTLTFLSKDDRSKMKGALEDTKELLNIR